MVADKGAVAAANMDKTLVKGLAILERLAPADEPVRLVDLARDLGLTKSGVHRLLQTLVKLGYVSVKEGGRYAATMKLWHLGSRVVEQIDSRRLLRTYLDALAQATMETVHFAVLDGQEMIYIDKADGSHSVRATAEIGSRSPAHAVASGKVVLAHQPREVVEALAGKLPSYTAKTLTDIPALERELAKVRREGYAVNRGEWVEQVCGVAAPVWDATGGLVGAIGITIPASRFVPAGRQAFIRQVTQAAAEASAALGAPDAPDEMAA